MERLTHFDGISYQPLCSKVECVQKLGILEDAEAEGSLMRLPCLGDVFIHSGDQIQEMEIDHYSGNRLGVYKMQCKCKEQYKDCESICDNENEKACAYYFRIDEIGKTVFLTPETAKAALKERENKNGDR